eukprot:TRINITY_DN22127_c0_g2_i1.p1 TRINITY_DN22127_c0_g2~~TRINITY_DN22127_c0_g2_i1.p1  ORF type:complete len:1112 (-),score=193.73 TRINITY_DN22127_c0_g2_i1:53-3322(-)
MTAAAVSAAAVAAFEVRECGGRRYSCRSSLCGSRCAVQTMNRHRSECLSAPSHSGSVSRSVAEHVINTASAAVAAAPPSLFVKRRAQLFLHGAMPTGTRTTSASVSSALAGRYVSSQENIGPMSNATTLLTACSRETTLARTSDFVGEQDKDSEDVSKLKKLRRTLHSREWDMVARIVLSTGSGDLTKNMLRAVAQESETLSTEQFRCLLKALRLRGTSPEHATELFRMVEPWFRQQCPGNDEWHAVLYALILDNRLDEAMDLVRAMESQSDPRLPKPDEATYCILIPAVARSRGLPAAASLLSRMSFQSLRSEPTSRLLMAAACASACPPDLDRAKLYMRQSEELMTMEICDSYLFSFHDKDYLYATLMAGYARLGRFKESFTLLGAMGLRGIRPSAFTFQILQHMCRLNIDSVREVRQLLRLMEQFGVEAETSNYNALIDSYGRSGQFAAALQVANRMREAGIPWDQWTYLALINAVIASDQVELALRLLAKMRRDGVRPTDRHYTNTFVGLARAGFYEDASRVFRRLASMKGLASQFAYNMMLGIHGQRGDMQCALDTFESMREEGGFEPDVMSYRLLIEGYRDQTDWESILSLQAPVEALRARLRNVANDSASTPAARAAAQDELEQTRSWTKIYYILIDAAVFASQWMRAVQLLEELVENGLIPDATKHSRLLQDCKPSVRFASQANRVEADPDWENMTEDEKVKYRAREKWSKAVPNVQVGVVAAPRGWKSDAGGSRTLAVMGPQTGESLPRHVFSVGFHPGWMNGGSGQDSVRLSPTELWGRWRARLQSNFTPVEDEDGAARAEQEAAYQVVYSFHHATVRQRSLASVTLATGKKLIGRVAPEQPETLRVLFDASGWPGSRNAPVYVFMTPASAGLDALLALLAASAAHPEEVLLLRPWKDPGGITALAEECRERKNRPLAFSLAALLRSLPAAVLVNSKFLIARSDDVMTMSCAKFEDNFRNALVEQRADKELELDTDDDEEDDKDEEESERYADSDAQARSKKRGSKPSTWVKWLQQQGLHQLIRHDGTRLRLDGVMHRPALSEAETFRARAVRDGQVSVDIMLPEESVEDGPSSFFAWF